MHMIRKWTCSCALGACFSKYWDQSLENLQTSQEFLWIKTKISKLSSDQWHGGTLQTMTFMCLRVLDMWRDSSPNPFMKHRRGVIQIL